VVGQVLYLNNNHARNEQYRISIISFSLSHWHALCRVVCHRFHGVTDNYCDAPSATSFMLPYWHLMWRAVCHKLHAVILTFLMTHGLPQSSCYHTDILCDVPSATIFMLSYWHSLWRAVCHNLHAIILTSFVTCRLPQSSCYHTDILCDVLSATIFMLSYWHSLWRAVCHKLHAVTVMCIETRFNSETDMRLHSPGKYVGCSSVAFHLHCDADTSRKSCSSTYLV
jgi:hypothetical protein